MLEFHSFINDMIDLFAVLDQSFQILKVYFLKIFWVYIAIYSVTAVDRTHVYI